MVVGQSAMLGISSISQHAGQAPIPLPQFVRFRRVVGTSQNVHTNTYFCIASSCRSFSYVVMALLQDYCERGVLVEHMPVTRCQISARLLIMHGSMTPRMQVGRDLHAGWHRVVSTVVRLLQFNCNMAAGLCTRRIVRHDTLALPRRISLICILTACAAM